MIRVILKAATRPPWVAAGCPFAKEARGHAPSASQCARPMGPSLLIELSEFFATTSLAKARESSEVSSCPSSLDRSPVSSGDLVRRRCPHAGMRSHAPIGQPPSRFHPHDSDPHPRAAHRLIEKVRRFAALTGVGHLVRLHPAAPFGYYMDTLSSDRDSRSCWPRRQRGWWWLAALSGQLDEVVSLPAPEALSESRGRSRACRHRAAQDRRETLVRDESLRDWLLDPRDEAAVALWHLLAFIRQLRAEAVCPRNTPAIHAHTNARGSRDAVAS